MRPDFLHLKARKTGAMMQLDLYILKADIIVFISIFPMHLYADP